MDSKLLKLYEKLKKKGLTVEQEEKIVSELNFQGEHYLPFDNANTQKGSFGPKTIYLYDDLSILQDIKPILPDYSVCIRSLDELLERDKQRESDGFPKKIRVGRLVKPGKGKADKIVVVPSTVEEKFIHDNTPLSADEDEGAGGSGEGEEGDIIGEQPIRQPGSGEQGAGEGEAGIHEVVSSAYDLGKILTEKFELPNLKDKGKKRSLTKYTYDLTDRNRGFGQILDKKETLKKIIETNITLGNLPDVGNIDPQKFLIAPRDKVYKILSREKDYESQAMVFFIRDYSGSMFGKTTELVVTQHVLIYSWLLYQYAKNVETRFILHDTQATEVDDFYTYYNSKVAGGTQVAAAYRLVNEIVQKENIEKDYNIYIFHGTDGDDWDTGGSDTLPELKKMLLYANRIGITIASHAYSTGKSEVESYITESGLLTEKASLLKLDVINEDADEQRLIDGIKKLIS